jgi:hypothetical protein
MNMRTATILLVTAVLAACSSSTAPIIDTRGVDMARYRQDLAECEAYKEQVKTGEGVTKGAAGGAAVGAAIGAIAGGSAGKGAGIGAVTGGAESARIADREKADVVKNCLRGRGYRVLN